MIHNVQGRRMTYPDRGHDLVAPPVLVDMLPNPRNSPWDNEAYLIRFAALAHFPVVGEGTVQDPLPPLGRGRKAGCVSFRFTWVSRHRLASADAVVGEPSGRWRDPR